jgi:hypothetical protein
MPDANALVTHGGDFNLAPLKQVNPLVAEMLDRTKYASENPNLGVTLLFNLKRINDNPLEYTMKLKDILTATGPHVVLFMVDTLSQSISSSGLELDWITNALLQYKKE